MNNEKQQSKKKDSKKEIDSNDIDQLSSELAKKITQMNKKNKKNIFTLWGINPIILLATVILTFVVGFSLLNRESFLEETSIDVVVKGLKDNKYSQILIQDDGRVVVNEKAYAILTSSSDVDVNSEPKDYKVLSTKSDNFEVVTLDAFIETIKTEDPFTRLKYFFNRSTSVVEEIIVGNNYVIGLRPEPQKSLLVKNISESDFLKKLDDKNLNLHDFQIELKKLRVFGVNNDQNSFNDKRKSNQFNRIFVIDNLYIAELKPELVNQAFIDWSPSIYSFSDILQKEGISLASENFEILSANIPSGITFTDIMFGIMLIALIVAIVIIWRGAQSSGMGIMQFGQSKAKVFFGQKPDTTFDDVAGIDEARDELSEIVEFLRDPNKYRKLGARIPKGVLLVGPPGTGKTLLARAIAGEAKVPFFHTSGSEFEEMLVGAGASRVRDLFLKAKKAAPALIFIDEIDAVARKRGTKIQTGATEQTLNQILVEMDGFEKNVNVIVLAATNRPDVLDPAILRPGRFDRQVRIEYPDMDGRKKILEIHGKNKPFAEDVDLGKIAKRTVGFTGADLENILNEAAIIAANQGKDKIFNHDIEEAVSKVVLGPAKKSRKRTEKELKLVAYHEAGHAVVAKYTPNSTPVDRISIVSRGNSGGVTMFLPENDEFIISKNKLIADITVSLGGRAAEEVALEDISTGASNDIEKATAVARRMIQKFGMSKNLGLVQYGDFEENEYLGYAYGASKEYSEKTAEQIDDEVREIVAKGYEAAKKILRDNKDKLEAVANALLEKEVMGKEEFEALF